MAQPAVPQTFEPADRRHVERRFNARLADLTLPELRRMGVTIVLFAVVLVLFLWMVRTVIIASFLGVVVAVYLRPIYEWLAKRLHSSLVGAVVALTLLMAPILGVLIYSYEDMADVATYLASHQREIAARIDLAVHRLPFMGTANTSASVRQAVLVASDYGTNIPGAVRAATAGLAVAATIFLFTAFYVMTDAESITAYVRSTVPPRYTKLSEALETNVKGVLYGAVYSTVLTQGLKSLIIFVMMLAFHIPLAAVLAAVSFVIGFFPIVGSWSVYVPVAAWLAVFRDATGQALIMLTIGFFVNTLYISTIMRPKIAAKRSRVLNFYWMLVGLITGVYTFGLVGILLGPILIGLLKAIFDTITNTPGWDLTEEMEIPAGSAP